MKILLHNGFKFQAKSAVIIPRAHLFGSSRENCQTVINKAIETRQMMQLHHLPDCFTLKLTSFLRGDKVGGKGYSEDFTYFELSVVPIQGINKISHNWIAKGIEFNQLCYLKKTPQLYFGNRVNRKSGPQLQGKSAFSLHAFFDSFFLNFLQKAVHLLNTNEDKLQRDVIDFQSKSGQWLPSTIFATKHPAASVSPNMVNKIKPLRSQCQ